MPKRRMFSPSSLNVFRDCPRCFYLEKIEKIKRPRGIFPSIPTGIDLVMKFFDDQRRVDGRVPEFISAVIPGAKLFENQGVMELMRSWNSTPLKYEAESYYITGGLDELLVTADGRYIPADYKTKGSPLRNDADPAKYDQFQMDTYGLLLQSSGYPIKGTAALMFVSPRVVLEGVTELKFPLQFNIQVYEIPIEPERAIAVANEAALCLNGKMPLPGPKCEYCPYINSAAAASITA